MIGCEVSTINLIFLFCDVPYGDSLMFLACLSDNSDPLNQIIGYGSHNCYEMLSC